ncbi:MAG TPA: zinc-ribbon domain-containing protein, partial [Albitalea sp.]
MSMATRCMACGTIFRVVPDQLKVSEGWVRCGRCDEVFNASEALFDLEREAPPPWQPGGTHLLQRESRHEDTAAQLDEDDRIASRFFRVESDDEPRAPAQADAAAPAAAEAPPARVEDEPARAPRRAQRDDEAADSGLPDEAP